MELPDADDEVWLVHELAPAQHRRTRTEKTNNLTSTASMLERPLFLLT